MQYIDTKFNDFQTNVNMSKLFNTSDFETGDFLNTSSSKISQENYSIFQTTTSFREQDHESHSMENAHQNSNQKCIPLHENNPNLSYNSPNAAVSSACHQPMTSFNSFCQTPTKNHPLVSAEEIPSIAQSDNLFSFPNTEEFLMEEQNYSEHQLLNGSRKISKGFDQENCHQSFSAKSSQRETRIKGKKYPWQPAEDAKLLELIKMHGLNWAIIAAALNNRTGKQVRDRYLNYLRPDIRDDEFSAQEDQYLMSLYSRFGRKWSLIARHMPGRSECQVKNRFYAHINKKSKHSALSEPSKSRRISIDNDLHCVNIPLLQNYQQKTKRVSPKEAKIELNDDPKPSVFTAANFSLDEKMIHSSGIDPTDVISYGRAMGGAGLVNSGVQAVFHQNSGGNRLIGNYPQNTAALTNHAQYDGLHSAGNMNPHVAQSYEQDSSRIEALLEKIIGTSFGLQYKQMMVETKKNLESIGKFQQFEELSIIKKALESFYGKVLENITKLEEKNSPS